MNLHPRGENRGTGGIIELLIVEWVMDYCVFPEEKRERGDQERKEGREKEGRGVKGLLVRCSRGGRLASLGKG